MPNKGPFKNFKISMSTKGSLFKKGKSHKRIFYTFLVWEIMMCAHDWKCKEFLLFSRKMQKGILTLKYFIFCSFDTFHDFTFKIFRKLCKKKEDFHNNAFSHFANVAIHHLVIFCMNYIFISKMHIIQNRNFLDFS